ncbi:SRPBCC family protein [Myxococcus sp. CA051A]|uniref:SRPBCC family protein n=1 Tax=Myxococcus sp. CA051A TaxID=2741739 RepID=UPI00157B0674|nr:SRPBCC family protein [Myxococcus sp. CA051A]NTX65463.1 SRPBCC family protein [Myxococcus sp. CA051A]
MLKKILIGLAALLLILAGIIATRPSEFTVQRTATLPASPDIVFAQVNDFHLWAAWSPWERLDPNMTRTHSGAASGVGAIYGWTGNDDVGEGRMTIEESKLNELARIKLEFIKPFAATSITTFAFKPVEGGTEVVWSMTGTNGFIAKAMCMVMDMDAMVGKDFESGFANLKTVVEAETKKRAEAEAARVAAAKAEAEKAAAELAAAAEAAAAGTQPVVAQPTP